MPPLVIVDNVAKLRDPAALARAFGGFRVWYTREVEGETAIYVSDLASAHETPVGAPVRVLDDGAAPSVIRFGEEILMYLERGEMLALAVSTDDGASFDVEQELFVGRKPGAAVFGDEVFLYFEADDGIRVAISADGRSFTDAGVVLARRATDEQAFDRQWVGDPAAVGGADRVVLFYVGRNVDGELAIGAAASRDGVLFERANKGEPVLEPGMRDETGPSALLYPAQGVLFFAQAFAQVTAIAVATSP